LFSTGDELLPVDADLEPGKIRESNSYALSVQIQSAGGEPVNLGVVPDEWAAVQNHLDQAVALGADLIVTSAGVSVGAYDFVRLVVEAHGSLDFWRVNMRPGKPLAFGTYRSVPFIGLPGNPVSAFVGFEVFLRPAVKKMGGNILWKREARVGILTQAVKSDGRESYLRGNILEGDGVPALALTGHQGSGNLFSLVQADALVVIPAGKTMLPAGEKVKYWPL
jgi:molybdopterin molybdotransferase